MTDNNISTNSFLGFSTQSLKSSTEHAVQQGNELENNVNGILKLQYPVFADKIDLAHSYGYTDEQIEPMLRKREQHALTLYKPEDINRVLQRTPQTIQQAAHIENMFRINALRQATGTSLNDDEIHERITASKLTGVPASVLISDNEIYEKVKPFAKMRRTLFDSVRIGLANYVKSFGTLKSENDYNNWLLSLDDMQFQQAVNNGQLSNEILDLLDTGFSLDDIKSYVAGKISRAQGWDNAVNSIASFLAPEPSPDPDSMIHSLMEIAPNVAAGIAEFWALKKIPGVSPAAVLTFMGAWRGWSESNEQVYANRIAQGDSVPDAYSQSRNALGLISAGIHGATSAVIMNTLGKPVDPFGIVGPVMQTAAKVLDASAYSAMGSMAASSFNDFRSGKNVDSEKALQEGRKSALWTGLFGLFSNLFNGKTLLNQQRDFNILRKVNNVLDNYGYTPISEGFSFQNSVMQIVSDLRNGILTHQELIDMFSDMGVSQEKIYSFINQFGHSNKPIGKYSAIDAEFSDLNETQNTVNIPTQNETVPSNIPESKPAASPIVTPPPADFTPNAPAWVFIPKAEWEMYNQTAQNNDIMPVAEIKETGEVMLNGQDFQRLQNTAPDFVDRIKDNIRDSANAVTKREKLISESASQNDDNSLNWNSPRIKTLRKKIFQQWREAGYTRGQAKSISDMITDFAINYSYRTGIDPEDAVRMSVINRENIYSFLNPEREEYFQKLNPDLNEVNSGSFSFRYHGRGNEATDYTFDVVVSQFRPDSDNDRLTKTTGRFLSFRNSKGGVIAELYPYKDNLLTFKKAGKEKPDLWQRHFNYEVHENLNQLLSDAGFLDENGELKKDGNEDFRYRWDLKQRTQPENFNNDYYGNAPQPEDFDNPDDYSLARLKYNQENKITPFTFSYTSKGKKTADFLIKEIPTGEKTKSEKTLCYYGESFFDVLDTHERVIAHYIPRIDQIFFVSGMERYAAQPDSNVKYSEKRLEQFKEQLRSKVKSILAQQGKADENGNLIPDGNEDFRKKFDEWRDRTHSVNIEDFYLPDDPVFTFNSNTQNADPRNPFSWPDTPQREKAIPIYKDYLYMLETFRLLDQAKTVDDYRALLKRHGAGLTSAVIGEGTYKETAEKIIHHTLDSQKKHAEKKLQSLFDEQDKNAFNIPEQKIERAFTFDPNKAEDADAYDPYTWPDTPERKKALPLYDKYQELLHSKEINSGSLSQEQLDELDEKINDAEYELENLFEQQPDELFEAPDNNDEDTFDYQAAIDEIFSRNKNIDLERLNSQSGNDDDYDSYNPYTWQAISLEAQYYRAQALDIFEPLDKWYQEHDEWDLDDEAVMPDDIAAIKNRISELEDDLNYVDEDYRPQQENIYETMRKWQEKTGKKIQGFNPDAHKHTEISDHKNLPEAKLNDDTQENVDADSHSAHVFEAFYKSDEFKKLDKKYQKLVQQGKIDPKRITTETDLEIIADNINPLDPYTWPDTPARLKALVIFDPLDKWLQEHEEYDDDDMPANIADLSNKIWELSNQSDDEAFEIDWYEDEKKNDSFTSQLHISQTNTNSSNITPQVQPEEQPKQELINQQEQSHSDVATLADFKKAFDKLERGQTFVNIPELRKKLAWPHDVFDEMIRKLRYERVIQLYETEVGKFEPEDFFYDEDDNSRMGMLTWHNPAEEGYDNKDFFPSNHHDFDITYSVKNQQASQSMPDASKYPASAVAHLILSDKNRFVASSDLKFSTLRDLANNAGIDDNTFDAIIHGMIDAGLITPVKGSNFDFKGILLDDDDERYPYFKINHPEFLQLLVDEPDNFSSQFAVTDDDTQEPVPDDIPESYPETPTAPIDEAPVNDEISDEQIMPTQNQAVPDDIPEQLLQDTTQQTDSDYDPVMTVIDFLRNAPKPDNISAKDFKNTMIQSGMDEDTFNTIVDELRSSSFQFDNAHYSVHLNQGIFKYAGMSREQVIDAIHEEIAQRGGVRLRGRIFSSKDIDGRYHTPKGSKYANIAKKLNKINLNLDLDKIDEKVEKIFAPFKPKEIRRILSDLGIDTFHDKTRTDLMRTITVDFQSRFYDSHNRHRLRDNLAKPVNRFTQDVEYFAGDVESLNSSIQRLQDKFIPQEVSSQISNVDEQSQSVPEVEQADYSPEFNEENYSPDYEINNAVLQDIPEQHIPDQQEQPIIKGRISWQKDIPAYEQTSIMELSNTHKDTTTAIHEIGHHMAKLLFDAVQFKGVDGEIKDDVNAALNHAGVSYEDYINDNNGAKEKVHEDFADEFTKFAASGNAPNERLRRAFSRIRAWLIDLFRDLQRRNYKIDENMRRVFEHLFTSQERIDYASKIGELASEAAALRELLIQAQNDLRTQIQDNAAKQKENETLQSQLISANDEISDLQQNLSLNQQTISAQQKQLDDTRSQISKLQHDLRSESISATQEAKRADFFKNAMEEAYDKLDKQEQQTAEKSLEWEQTAENAFVQGKNTGERYGIQEGMRQQKQNDDEILNRTLLEEHSKQALEQARLSDKKDAQIARVKEQRDNALAKLKEKKNSQIERIKERYSDRLDALADRYDERIAKLKKRLEEISKIKPAVQLNVKQISRMAKSKNISYNVQQEINELLSGFDLKKRSRNTLSHRHDIDELLKNDPQAISQLTPDEIRFAGTTNIADMTLDDLRYLKWQVKVLYDKGRREFEQREAEAKKRRGNIRSKLVERINRFNAPDDHIITSREDIGKQYKGIKGKAQKAKDWSSAVLRTPDRVFDILDGGGAHYNGPWVENFIDVPREKINEAQSFINSRKDKMINALAQLGFKISDFGKTAAVIDGQKFSFDKIMEIFLGMRNPKKAKAIIFGNFVNPRGYSPEQAKDVINQLISKLTPEHMKAAELVIQDHNDNFQRINNSLINTFNKGMKQEVDYTSMHRLLSNSPLSPLFIDPDDDNALRNGLSDSELLQKLETGFMLSRQNISDENQQPLDLGLFSNWMRDISRHEFAAALGQTASDLMSVLLSKNNNRQTLMRMIADRFGNTMRKSVVSIFNDTFTDNQRAADEFLRSVAGALSRNMSAAYIAYNMGVYVMQTMSYPLFLMSARPDYLFSSVAKFFRNPRAFLDNVYRLSPTIKNMGRDPTDNRDNLMRSLNSSFWQKVINAGLEPTSILDRITKAIGWQATYDTNIKRGLSHENAIREADRAVRLTQPPSNTRDTMRITRNGPVAALKMKFTYALASAWNMTTYDFIQKLFSKGWNNIKSAFSTFAGLALTAMLVKFMHDGGPDRDNDENVLQWAAGAFSDQSINSIPLIGKDAMQSYNKYFRGKHGHSQFDAFSAPVDKVLNAMGIISKEDKSDDDYARLGWLVLEALSLTTGLSPYSGLKQTIRSFMMAAEGEPLKAIANFLGFRQKD